MVRATSLTTRCARHRPAAGLCTIHAMTDPRGVADQAYRRIRQAIVEGRYPPGHRLVEQRIAEELSLSRTPVREALHVLEAEGLVVAERNKGSTVRSLTADDVHDIYELRARLESLAAELAAVRSGPGHHERLDRALAEFDRTTASGGRRSVGRTRLISEANEEFHSAIVEAAQHPRLQRILNRTVDIPLVFRAFQSFDQSELERSALFHRLIRDAIVAGDRTRAGNLMTEHILQGRDVLLGVLTADA